MGRVWKFGDDVNTDEIIAKRFMNATDPNMLAKHCFSDLRPDFASYVAAGDVIVAGHNFGSGSSREHAPVAIKAAGVKAVIASSFARIFHRNAVNVGLPVFIPEDPLSEIGDGDDLEIDFDHFSVKHSKTGKTFRLKPFPPFILKIFKAGGIIPLLREGSLEDLC
jgi:3-isopropylmalate/(R)-2-methylmalate dehydratase small subunit